MIAFFIIYAVGLYKQEPVKNYFFPTFCVLTVTARRLHISIYVVYIYSILYYMAKLLYGRSTRAEKIEIKFSFQNREKVKKRTSTLRSYSLVQKK